MVRAIETPEQFELSDGLPEGYTAQVVLVPFALPNQDPMRHELDDRDISVPKSLGSIKFTLFANNGSQVAGVGVFAADVSGIRCDSVEVVPDHRRKKIATWMYVTASAILDAPVYPSDDMSNDARAFWAGRGMICAEGVAHHS